MIAPPCLIRPCSCFIAKAKAKFLGHGPEGHVASDLRMAFSWRPADLDQTEAQKYDPA